MSWLSTWFRARFRPASPTHPPLPTPPAQATLAVTVTDDDAHPLAGVRVRLNDEDTPSTRTVTNADGYAALVVPCGPLAYAIEADGYHPIHRTLTVTTNTHRTYRLTALPAPFVLPTTPPVPRLTRLRVEANRRYLAHDHGRFDWREISAFSLLSRLLVGEHPYVRDWLQRRRAEGFTVTRVILTLDGDYWSRSPLGGRSFRCAPDMPGYWEALDQLVALHAEVGLYLRVCFLGGLEPFGGVWDPVRREDIYRGSVRSQAEAFVRTAAGRIGGRPWVIGELANEPTQIGMRDAWSNGALVALGIQVKAVAPEMLLIGGEDNDGRGLVRPFDIADAHMDRSRGVAGWQWVKRTGEHPASDQDLMPFIAGEPINFGEDRIDGRTGDVESQPVVAFGAAAVGRSRRWAGQCFHYDGGLWTTEPTPTTKACIAAWHQGMDAFPMLTDKVWRGHWGRAAGDYWNDVWPETDDVAAVEAHIRAGRGPWRAFGCGPYSVVFPQPKGWDWHSRVELPVERVAIQTSGTFDCAVYRRA